MKKSIHHDVYIGVVVLLISVLALVKTSLMPEQPAIFPGMMLITVILFMISVIWNGIKKTRLMNDGSGQKIKTISFAETKMPLVSFLIVVVYAALIGILGFFVSTVLFVTGFMIFYRVRDWKKILLTIGGLCVFIYLLFVMQLNVPLPTGILF